MAGLFRAVYETGLISTFDINIEVQRCSGSEVDLRIGKAGAGNCTYAGKSACSSR